MTASSNPRESADDAFAAFMSMPQPEWEGLIRSMMGGGCLTVPEQEGFARALLERPRPSGPREVSDGELRAALHDALADTEP